MKLLKTQVLEKKDIFPAKKLLSPISSTFIECDEPLKTFYWGPQAILTITLELMGALF